MRRSDLIVWMSGKARQLSKECADERLHGIISEIRQALLSQRRVEFRGLGALELRPRRACVLVQPKTRQKKTIPAGYRIHFKAARALETILNQVGEPDEEKEIMPQW